MRCRMAKFRMRKEKIQPRRGGAQRTKGFQGREDLEDASGRWQALNAINQIVQALPKECKSATACVHCQPRGLSAGMGASEGIQLCCLHHLSHHGDSAGAPAPAPPQLSVPLPVTRQGVLHHPRSPRLLLPRDTHM